MLHRLWCTDFFMFHISCIHKSDIQFSHTNLTTNKTHDSLTYSRISAAILAGIERDLLALFNQNLEKRERTHLWYSIEFMCSEICLDWRYTERDFPPRHEKQEKQAINNLVHTQINVIKII